MTDTFPKQPQERPLGSELWRHARQRDSTAFVDTLQHEGLKHLVDWALCTAARNRLGRAALRAAAQVRAPDERLATTIGPVKLARMAGLGPGWAKNCDTLRAWEAMGAGFVVLGGVSLRAQGGKTSPRLYTFDNSFGDKGTRLSINSFGFPNRGAATESRALAREYERGLRLPVFVQVVPNAEMLAPDKRDQVGAELAQAIQIFLRATGHEAIAGFNLGISSPNTAGLRDTDHDWLRGVYLRTREAAGPGKPILIKGHADGGIAVLDDYCQLINDARDAGDPLLGAELINTTTRKALKVPRNAGDVTGGFAGADATYQEMARNAVAYVRTNTSPETPIVGVGGIWDSRTAVAMIEAGANAVGANTGVRSRGTRLFTGIEAELPAYMPAGSTISDLVSRTTSLYDPQTFFRQLDASEERYT